MIFDFYSRHPTGVARHIGSVDTATGVVTDPEGIISPALEDIDAHDAKIIELQFGRGAVMFSVERK